MPYPPKDRSTPAQYVANRAADLVDRAHRRTEAIDDHPSDNTDVHQFLRSRRLAERIRTRTDVVRLWSALIELEIATVQDEVAVAHDNAADRGYHARTPAHTAGAQPQQADDIRFVQLLAERLVECFEARAVRRQSPHEKDRKLALLETEAELRALVNRRIDQLVSDSRSEGATWAQIAQALHVTRQTAHQRYRHGITNTAD